MAAPQHRPWWRLTFFVLVMLVVEFQDEFAYSVLEAARPLIRDSFGLSYVQIGLVTTLPVLAASVIEPVVGIFADTRKRRSLIVGGGILFGIGLIIQGLSPSFALFMLGATIQAPASGAFVNIAQASLMDDAPQRRENRMALWTFSGSLAVVVGPLLLTAALGLGTDWRTIFVGSGVLSVLAALLITRLPASHALRTTAGGQGRGVGQNVRGALALLGRGEVWRWLALLEFANLMMDVLFSLLALYMVDVVGVTQAQAGIAIAVWTGIGLIGDFLLIPILERIRGLAYLRFSAGMELVLFPVFLLVNPWWVKLALLGLIGLFNAGWYAILQGKLYDALGEQSGAVLIVGNAAGVFGAALPLILGLAAQTYGLGGAMWFLLAGPLALLIGLPRSGVTKDKGGPAASRPGRGAC
jgi:FSR family fosmidomycin resistance protein-like MFS transporter